MGKASLVLALALGVGLSAAWAQDAREKSKTPTTPTNSPPARSTPPAVPGPALEPFTPPLTGRRSIEAKIRRFAETLLRRYDTNKDGVLEQDEWSRMRSSWHKADLNGDGKITLDELTAFMMQALRAGSAPKSSAPSIAPPAVRPLPPVNAERPWRRGGQEAVPPEMPFPPIPALAGGQPPPSSSGHAAWAEKPIDPQAPLVSVQLVIGQFTPEVAKGTSRPQAQAGSGPSQGPITLSLDLSAPSETILKELHKHGLRGQLDVLYQVQLTTADQQMGYFNFGQQQSIITGVTITAFGQTNNTQSISTGLIATVEPRVSGGTVSMNVNFTESHLGRAEEGTPIAVPKQGEAIRIPVTHQAMLQTAVNVPDGQTIVLGGLTTRDGAKQRQFIVLICPRIVRLHPNKP